MPLSSLKPRVKGEIDPIGDTLVVARLPEETVKDGIVMPERLQFVTTLVRGQIVRVGRKVSPHHKFDAGQIVHYPRVHGYPKFITKGTEVEVVPIAQVYAKEE